MDINSGNVTDSVQWKIFSKNNKVSNFKLEHNKLYITNLNDDEIGLLCLDINTNKMIWNVKGASLYGLYKNYIIGYNPDGSGSYLIIDKNTGLIKDKIAKPDRFKPGFFFIDDYIFIHNAIYK
jgi:outer membrane protein assembly factor BamB